jgi:ubiquinone/menaquinone biosynthesis C-methylase UbiE
VDNQNHFSHSSVVSSYADRDTLLSSEATWLTRNADRFRGTRILDLGMGCGRTSPHLMSVSSNYIGVDYSHAMVDCARRRLPGVDFRIGDARALDFPERSFDLVVFSFNGIDYVDRADRWRILREVNRVLVLGGTFLFSSHNLGRPLTSAFSPRNLDVTLHPLRLAWRTGRWAARHAPPASEKASSLR